MAQPIRVGLVGFGISATVFHAPFFVTMPEFELVAVLERTKNESQKKYPFVKVVRTIEELVDDPTIDLIVITTPNDTHFPYSKAALLAGKHVVVEKPFTNTTAEAKELVDLAALTGKVLSVYQNRRYVSDFLTIRDLLDKKLLGEVHEFEGHYDRYRAEARPQAWREHALPGSGILFDLGAHLLDQVLYLFGLPQAITADIRQQRPHAKVDDYFDIRLNYGFTKVILHAGMLVREPGPRYMIHGTVGSFIKYGEDPQEARLRAGDLPVGDDWGKEAEDTFGLLHTEIDGKLVKERMPSKAGDYSGYYRHIYNTIRLGAPLKEKPEHGYNTVRMIELAFESHTRQCTIPCSDLLDAPYR
ncbi:oxidoreductase [Paraflavitalea sp. CAU 1676]|uniref:oxidoreductase n=1 Tax=Paraflavitalea sp. CAU 1676 TaxID=3032598 RepID=UPI0023DA97C1|nr:oxidoreductase [Paraflavitalea sp. CAU 1676]MDF2189525.1 oxidoreductase [Paraflavitalea sp. CAU 1676]